MLPKHNTIRFIFLAEITESFNDSIRFSGDEDHFITNFSETAHQNWLQF